MRQPFQTPLAHSYWVEPGRFLAGEHPGSSNTQYAQETIGALLQAGIASFIDLTEEPEWVSYVAIVQQQAQNYAYPLMCIRQAIPDRGTPSIQQMGNILDQIDEALAMGRGIYIHCLAGIGRTGLIVGCYLVRRGLTGEQALLRLAHLRRYGPDAAMIAPETEGQRNFMRRWKPGA